MGPLRVRYADSDYWDERYKASPTPFDWFYGYGAFRRLLKHTINKKKLMLHIGCGNSTLQEGMGREGYQIVNTDISSVVIEQMREKMIQKQIPGLTYLVSDCRDMPEFSDCKFGSVLDKGTLDALLCCKDGESNVNRMFSEISRVLQPGGMFLLITLGEPQHRLHYLQHAQYQWTVSVCLVPRASNDDQRCSEDAMLDAAPLRYIGPLNVLNDGTVVGLPEPWDPSSYFYAYLCKKNPLILSTSKHEKVRLPESWRHETKQIVKKLQAELGFKSERRSSTARAAHNRASYPHLQTSDVDKFPSDRCLTYLGRHVSSSSSLPTLPVDALCADASPPSERANSVKVANAHDDAASCAPDVATSAEASSFFCSPSETPPPTPLTPDQLPELGRQLGLLPQGAHGADGHPPPSGSLQLFQPTSDVTFEPSSSGTHWPE